MYQMRRQFNGIGDINRVGLGAIDCSGPAPQLEEYYAAAAAQSCDITDIICQTKNENINQQFQADQQAFWAKCDPGNLSSMEATSQTDANTIVTQLTQQGVTVDPNLIAAAKGQQSLVPVAVTNTKGVTTVLPPILSSTPTTTTTPQAPPPATTAVNSTATPPQQVVINSSSPSSAPSSNVYNSSAPPIPNAGTAPAATGFGLYPMLAIAAAAGLGLWAMSKA